MLTNFLVVVQAFSRRILFFPPGITIKVLAGRVYHAGGMLFRLAPVSSQTIILGIWSKDWILYVYFQMYRTFSRELIVCLFHTNLRSSRWFVSKFSGDYFVDIPKDY